MICQWPELISEGEKRQKLQANWNWAHGDLFMLTWILTPIWDQARCSQRKCGFHSFATTPLVSTC
jgi:hypothetical protein